jgi:hypothetical protein
MRDDDESDLKCANCGEPWSSAEQYLTAQMYDGEWVCSQWCEDVHADEGCPLEKSDGEQRRRRARRLVAGAKLKLADLPPPPALSKEDLERIHAEADVWRAAAAKGVADLHWLSGEERCIRLH